MATSPIYSWPEPDNTDLVKNGALAIRTLGDAIDTTMGTMVAKTIVDAKGDLIAATAADTVARLAVGTNGQTLVADSSTATGLKWATAASGSTFVGCLAVNRGSQPSIANATYTAVPLNVEIYDTDSIHSTVTNTSRFTIPAGKGGYWLFYATLGYNDLLGNYQVKFYKNGAATGRAIFPSNTNASYSSGSSITEIISCSAADYIELYTYQTGGGSETLQVSSTDDFVFMGCTYLGA